MTATTGPASPTRTMPWIVSVDDHVVEPADMFERWLERRYLPDAPRVERRRMAIAPPGPSGIDLGVVADADSPWGDVWVFGRAIYPHRRNVTLLTQGDGSPVWRTAHPVTYDEMRPGCYDPKARVADMNANHVEASLGFPTFPRFCGQAFTEETEHDRAFGLALVRAYNDWVVEEWCGDSGGRLIPCCVLPLWDVDECVKEVERNAARGVHAITFSEIPYHLGLPSVPSGYWDKLFAVCQETATVVCMHIGSSSKVPVTSPDAPALVRAVLTFNNCMASVCDFVFSGVLARFPGLQLAYSEGQIGWMPYVLERMDEAYIDHPWARTAQLERPPSQYMREQVFGCFFNDRHGLRCLDEIGENNVMFETDYPHADGSFPGSEALARELLADHDDNVVEKILRGNARRLFSLD